MPPKVRSASTPPDSMATQPDSPAEVRPEEVPQTQCVPEPDAPPDAPPKRKRGRPRGKGSKTTNARRAALVKNVISKNILVHPKIVQQVLNELENVCVETVKKKGVFRMRFLTVKLREARQACLKQASPTHEITPGKNLKKVCK